MRCNWGSIAVAVWALLGCGGPMSAADAGQDGGARLDAPSAVPCTRDLECDDDLFCTVHRCMPGTTEADPRGCVSVGSPCDASEACSEEGDECVGMTCSGDPDADGDGHDSTACGGDDCDDGDPDRYAGNSEVCDSDGHDEDCDLTTLGATDADGDGFVSNACCNDDVCGRDCDDASSSFSPTVTEVCNGVDDNCDGMTDEVSTPALCPGGTCLGGSCQLGVWDRTYGDTGNDGGAGVAMDEEGNVYILGAIAAGTIDVGGGPVTSSDPSDVVFASYSGDGTYRWETRLGSNGTDFGGDLSVVGTGAARRLYAILRAGEATTFGGTLAAPVGPGTVLVSLDGDGTLLWGVTLPVSTALNVVADALGVVVATTVTGTADFGGGPTSVPSGATGFVGVRFSASGAYEWDSEWARCNGSGTLDSLAHTATGWVFVGDCRAGPLVIDGTTHPNTGDVDSVVASVDASGAIGWSRLLTGARHQRVYEVAVDSRGNVYAVGTFGTQIAYGDGMVATGTGSSSGFLLALGPDGTYRWNRVVRSCTSICTLTTVGVDELDRVVAMGTLSGDGDYGGGLLTSTRGNMVVTTFTSESAHVRDFLQEVVDGSISASRLAVGRGGSVAISGSFSGTVNLGRGNRRSAGLFDSFVVRLATE